MHPLDTYFIEFMNGVDMCDFSKKVLYGLRVMFLRQPVQNFSQQPVMDFMVMKCAILDSNWPRFSAKLGVV